jgi:predicted phage terminase large subunit-like protein
VLAPHLDLLHRELLDVIGGRTKRLLVQMPPRHGKSEFISVYFPAWWLGSQPDSRVILASYEHDFAASWGRRVRDVLKEYGPELWGVQVRRDQTATDDWQFVGRRGGMVCAGVGGPITGRGADLLVIDDPVKSAEEANSETYRQRAWDWYRSTAYTRLEPGGCVVLVTTRWHEDDLAGRILAEPDSDAEAWRVLSLPALAEENDPLGREPDVALWPERYPVDALAAIRAQIGPYWWAALYQQRPAPPQGALFRASWWRYYERVPLTASGQPDMQDVILSLDCSFTGADTSDYVCAQIWGRRWADCYLLDQIRERADFVETLRIVESLCARWPQAQVKLVEASANGPAVISALQHKIPGLVAVKPKAAGSFTDNSKRGRAQAIAWLVEGGNVYLPAPSLAPWVDAFVTECSSFPLGAHDDQVDAMTMGLGRFMLEQETAPLTPDPSLPVTRTAEDAQRLARRGRTVESSDQYLVEVAAAVDEGEEQWVEDKEDEWTS